MSVSTEVKTKKPVQTNAGRESSVKVCSRCQQVKAANLTNFYKSNHSPSGLYSICRDCKNKKKPKVTDKRTCKKCFESKDPSEFEGTRSTCRKCRSKACYEGANKEAASERHRSWRRGSKENLKKHNASARRWKKKNPHKVAEGDDRRKEAIKRAKPEWFEKEKVATLYLKARQMGMQVDHIVPLQSKLVCGLHCWHNLQLLSASENASKKNLHWPDMWDQK